MRKGKPSNTKIEDRKRDGERALAEQRAKDAAVNKNMARLRALRLEPEAAGETPQDEAKPPEKKQPASLAKYLKHQKSSAARANATTSWA
jgi:hypothetical protein